MQTQRSRWIDLGLLTLVLAVVWVLAAGITGLELKAGEPFPLDLSYSMDSGGGQVPGGDLLIQIFRIFYTIFLILVPISLIYALLDPKSRKNLLKFVLTMLPILLLVYWVFNSLKNMRGEPQEQFQFGFPSAPDTGEGASPAVDFTPSPSQGLILALSLGLAIIVLLLVGLVAWQFWRRSHSRPSTMERLVQRAQAALDEIDAGSDLKNAIIRCYKEMSLVVAEKRGVQRGYSMTSHEFEQLLVNQGLPRQPVHQLTQVFEEVRYGVKQPGVREEVMARDSLSAIIQACNTTPAAGEADAAATQP